ncbi:MAG: TniB family NTP-binding protein, partial [Cyanobacteria bacterium J06638_22]
MSEIRDIADLLEIAVVLVGTDRLNAVINRDEQVLYRYLSAYCFSRLGTEGLKRQPRSDEGQLRMGDTWR